MPSKIEDVKPVNREITIQDLPCVVTFDVDGITIQRKGDRHRGKRELVLSWNEVMDFANPFKYESDDPNKDIEKVKQGDDYAPTSFLEYEEEE